MSLPRHLEELLDPGNFDSQPDPQPVEMRCEGGAMHGKKMPDGLIEIKCHFKPCTKGVDQVFHYYDPETGALVRTWRCQDPAPKLKGRKR